MVGHDAHSRLAKVAATVGLVACLDLLAKACARGLAFDVAYNAEPYSLGSLLILSAAMAALLVPLLMTPAVNTMMLAGWALVAGGACANVIEHAWRGAVTDFIPAGPVSARMLAPADLALFGGALLYIVGSVGFAVRVRRRETRRRAEA